MTDQEERREEFYKRAEKCKQILPGVLDFLITVAANAGNAVEPTFEEGGAGITYRTESTGQRFCRFDPKFDLNAKHVFACIPGASREQLKSAGTLPEPPRQDEGWVKVENMRGAVRLVPLILRKYDNASGRF